MLPQPYNQHFLFPHLFILSMEDHFQLASYDFHLPEKQIAQYPADERDQSRLLVMDCPGEQIFHRQFSDITNFLRPGDLLVVNNTKVFPARLLGHKETGGKVEILLLHFPEKQPLQTDNTARAKVLTLVKSSKRPRKGSLLHFPGEIKARVDTIQPDGKVAVTLLFPATKPLELLLEKHGQIPLPPYITRAKGTTNADAKRYQTTYARHTGSVAAPTAGLHFTSKLLNNLADMGIGQTTVTLHVGYGTFAPVRCNDIREHIIHKEYIKVSQETSRLIRQTRQQGGRIWAVGTTTARTLEFAARKTGQVHSVEGLCGLYIYPGYQFKVVDNLITNFHLPESSLLFLVSALAGREQILQVYNEAIQQQYRFFSYGDAMAIITKP